MGRRELWDFQPAAPIPKRSLEQLRLDGMEALLRVFDRKYWYPGGHLAQVQNVRSGLAGRWIDVDGSLRGSPAKD